MTDHRLTEERIAAFRRFLGEQEKARDTIEKYLGTVRDFVLWTKADSKRNRLPVESRLAGQRLCPGHGERQIGGSQRPVFLFGVG